MKFYLDTHNPVVTECFKKMKWTAVGPKKDWNIYWATQKKCCTLFRGDQGYRMLANQMVNHFPNSSELCRKDLLLKNIRRYNRELKRDAAGTRRSDATDFFPTTFEMPKEYDLFLEEFTRGESKVWIMKPVGKCHGNGIFLVNRLSQVDRWSPAYRHTLDYRLTGAPEPYVISRYVTKPLLLYGKKCDMRLYVLVTSFRPLKAYLFNHGICRICTVPYTNRASEMENGFVHLTNASVQKQPGKVNKVTIGTLKEHLDRTRGKAATRALIADVRALIVHSLKAVQPVMFYDKHCFECYGYDVMVDRKLKPWLLEINSSPSLVATSELDRALKKELVGNVLRVVLPPDGVPNTAWNKRPSAKATENFQLLIDEEETRPPV
uniref:Putative tubulin polyglutamylase TTLL1 n=1 Tax=Sipha flava TaxID=143950 RepID=A0A2S2QC69_9HEMI